MSDSLAGSASSPAGRSLSFSLVSQPQFGTVALSAAGAFTYTRSDPGRGNLDSFIYRVTDSEGLTAQATAQVIYGRRRIMPLGDSITDGVEFTNGAGDQPAVSVRVGYRKALYDRLTTEGYAVDFVGSQNAGASAGLADTEHEGYPGFTQAQLGPIIDQQFVARSPDVVLLHIGTNDVNQGGTDAAATSALLGKIEAFVADAASPPAHVLLATIIKQQVGAPNASKVATFNASLTGFYNSTWSTAKPKLVVSLVDMNSKLVPATDLSSLAQDSVGLHPNTSGYGKMADAWFESLVQTGGVVKCP